MLENIRNAQAGDTIWDKDEKASVKGLHVRVLADGQKNFFLYYRTRDKKERRPKIGALGEITLAEARKRAKIISDKVSLGEDPKGLWDDKAAEMTVEALFEQTLTEHWDNERFRASKRTREVKGLYRNHLKPSFGNLKLSEVTPLKVREWHRGLVNKPYVGNRALEVLTKMFHYAEELELRNQNSNPCHLVKSHPERKRRRYATEAEIQKIAGILEKETKNSPAGVAFIYLLMFSGSRPRAIERATWEQLREFRVGPDLYGELTFHGKSSAVTGEEEKVILPPQAMRAISRLPKIEGHTITGIQMPRRLWRRVKTEVGCTDLWARDWRRTFATIGMSAGVNIGTIGELLNHHSSDTTKVYAKLMNGPAAAAVSTIAGRLEEMMSQEKRA